MGSRRNARWHWSLFVCLTLSLIWPGSALAQQIVLKAGHIQKPDHPFHLGVVEFAKRVAAKTGDRVKVDILAGGILGSEADMFQAQMKGTTVDLTVNTPANMEQFVKEVGLFDLYYLFDDFDHWKRAVNGPIGQKMADIVEKKTDVKIVGFYGASERIVFSRTKPIRSLDDLKGFRMRVFAGGVLAKSWEQLGTVPTVIAFPEQYGALMAGVVDGAENEPPTILSAKLYEPSKYMALTNHQIIIRFLTISGKRFRSLPADVQAAVLEAGRESADFETRTEREISEKAIERFKAFGVQINTVDRKPFIARIDPFNRQIAKDLGAEALLEEIIALRRR